MKDLITDAVFQAFPTFVRGVCVARDVTIRQHDSCLNECLLGAAIQREREGKPLLDNPLLSIWDDAHRAFGSNPNRFPPSIRSLIERTVRGKPLPFINTAVAAFNTVSLTFLLPCGGDDLDAIGGDTVLGLAAGDETFVPLGGGDPEQPIPGEVIYVDSATKQVMCRRWNWRNGDITKMTVKTKNMLINVDGLGANVMPTVEEATRHIAYWIRTICGGTVRTDILHIGRRSIEV